MDLQPIQLISIILGSTVLGSFLTAIVSKRVADKNIRVEHITRERKQWRDRLRQLVVEVNEKFHADKWTEIRVLKAELSVRLNPLDDDDKAILASLQEVIKRRRESELTEFNDRMALLLKHDWERVKIEASGRVPAHTMSIGLLFAALCLLGLGSWLNYMHFAVWTILIQIGVFFSVVSGLVGVVNWLADKLIKQLPSEGENKAELARLIARVGNKALRVPYSLWQKEQSSMPNSAPPVKH